MLTLIVKAFAGNSQCTATSLSRLSAPRSTVIATGPFCDRGHPRMSGPAPRLSQENANYQILISASNFKGNANTFVLQKSTTEDESINNKNSQHESLQ